MIHQASGNTIRNAVAAVRKQMGWDPRKIKMTLDSHSGDNLHRVTMSNGDVIEVTTIYGAPSKYEGHLA